jgi:ABC-2 type transport system permease protein
MKPRTIGIICKKEIQSLLNERTLILAIMLQVFIALFSSFLMVGLTSMYDPATISQYSHAEYGIGYAGNDSALRSYIEQAKDFKVFPMDLSTGLAALSERKLSAVVYVPDTSPNATDPIKVTLYTQQNDLQSAVVNIRLKDVFIAYEKELRQVRAARLTEVPIPLRFPAQTGGSDFFEFVYGLLIPLLVFMPAIISSAMIIDLITEEYEHRTLEVLLAAPVSFGEVIWGKIVACLVLVPIQAGAWMVLLQLNGIAILHGPEILLHVTAGSCLLVLLGALTALHYRERTSAQFIFSTALVIVMLGGLALPMNPLNLIARLSIGAIGNEHWIILAGVLAAIVLLSILTTKYAGIITKRFIEG